MQFNFDTYIILFCGSIKNIFVSLCTFIMVVLKSIDVSIRQYKKLPSMCWGHPMYWAVVWVE